MQIARLAARCQIIEILVAMLHLVMCDVIISKFTSFYGNTTLWGDYKGNVNIFASTKSLTACVAMCSMDATCSIVNYHPESSTCVLMNWRAVSTVIVQRKHKPMENTIAVKEGRKRD